MRRFFRIIIFALLFALTAAALSSCKVDIGDEAAFRAEVGDLIERSYEVNELFFGKGLPFVDPDGKTAEQLLAEAQTELEARTLYRPVAEDAEYQTESEIMELAATAYSESYLRILREVGFTGANSEDVVTYARYIYSAEQGLMINIESVSKALPLDRTYDVSTISIGRRGRDYVLISVDSFANGKKDTIELRVNKDASGWRLDWPTY